MKETGSFRVIMDAFPILPGHIMVISHAHYGCAGELGADLLIELAEIKMRVRRYFETLNGSCIFYEHGRAGGCIWTPAGDLACEHFHLHCLPVNVSVMAQLQEFLKVSRLSHYKEMEDLFYELGNYLYFENISEEMYFCPVGNHPITPHFLRSLICKSLGSPERSDWRLYDQESVFEESYNMLLKIGQEL